MVEESDPSRASPFDKIDFDLVAGGPTQLVPVINGISLIDLVASFERSQGRDSGRYAGLLVEHFQSPLVTRAYPGSGSVEGAIDAWAHGRGPVTEVLACECGEIGCWPLDAEVTVDDGSVIWHGFSQPHRPAWDYSDFGPFRFEQAPYDRAVLNLLTRLPGGA